ncbi:hypothetical protein Bbelb_363480 [Branchiostoma belcheri]|nr:hypothetical protein Bbelb_363480 [Branchiostoma belcheri]
MAIDAYVRDVSCPRSGGSTAQILPQISGTSAEERAGHRHGPRGSARFAKAPLISAPTSPANGTNDDDRGARAGNTPSTVETPGSPRWSEYQATPLSAEINLSS